MPKTMERNGMVLWAFIGIELLYLGCAIICLGISTKARTSLDFAPTVRNVAVNLLLYRCPHTGL